ncbi:hypothetical protein Palpr_1455 [Paludibacter propionicigenes WB4]|uniref:Lipoprotein n=1 Tax=Paludibacter propionicigenes (strain DSM 17365 / JCM 13257 / WB4) TaxID=694427 RepID=E4T4F7_PALPW|nr:SusD/RagB family nutrient-binding outer membrane lipoprotein [Paludibacter propionicigenes]ADQ79601.1 hypothetical protein Palpr_1455 [Paludibacter propionicigenes WB4]
MKYLSKKIALLVLITLAFSSCTNFDELNTDPTRLNQSNPGTLLNPVLYEMASYNWSRYNDYTFPLMQGTVSTSSISGVGWYNIQDAAGDGSWSTYYKWLTNIKEMEKQAIKLNEPNYRAIGMTLRSWIFQLLTDGFGDIPMTEACRGGEGILTPKFDNQLDVYKQIINDLDSANMIFDTANGLKYNADGELLYGTNTTLTSGVSTGIVKWKRFCNSLRMRALLRTLNVSDLNSKNKLSEMLTNPTKYPVFESNTDAALLPLSGVNPQLAPMTRPQDFTAYIYLSEFFVENLKTWNDPRLALFATQATNGTVKSYIGLPSGYAVTPSINASQPKQALAIAPMKITLMSYAELELIKAEYDQRFGTATDAGNHYKKGVTASIEQWGGVVPATYFSNAAVAYNGTLEQLMTQKYYALFFCDYQAWYEYNRTGLPKVPRGVGVSVGKDIPKRFKYPMAIQRTNMKNYQLAKANMGGDEFSIKLIWQ